MNPLLDPNARLVIAHRGNRVRAPENTLEGLRDALALGADAVEFDVRVTRDGIPVVLHDPDLDRTTDGRGLLRMHTLEELHEFEVSSPVADPAFSGARIPSLEEVLDALRDVPLVIEVKEVEAVAATERLIRKFGAQKRVVTGSSEAAVSKQLYRCGLSACASMADAIKLIPLAMLGFRPAAPAFNVLSVTPRFRGVAIPVVRMAELAKKLGIATQVWTVNDPIDAARFWEGGVAGIVTDDPGAMVRARMR